MIQSGFYLTLDPLQVTRAPVGNRQDDELGQFVRMELSEALLNGEDPIACGLDDQLLLEVALDGALPAIERCHRREQVDAGGEVLFDQRPGDGLSSIARRDGRQDEDDVGHRNQLPSAQEYGESPLYFRRAWCTVSVAWPSPTADPRRSKSSVTDEPGGSCASRCSFLPC